MGVSFMDSSPGDGGASSWIGFDLGSEDLRWVWWFLKELWL